MSVDALYEAVFAHAGPWTEDDYFALPEMPTKVELVDGLLVVNPLSESVHQRLVLEICYLLYCTCPTGIGRCSRASTSTLAGARPRP